MNFLANLHAENMFPIFEPIDQCVWRLFQIEEADVFVQVGVDFSGLAGDADEGKFRRYLVPVLVQQNSINFEGREVRHEASFQWAVGIVSH